MVKKLIRLTESDLHRIVKESVNRILKESVGRRKGIHETPRVSVKQLRTKYRGRDPKGINYNVYVDGVKMFRATLNDSEYDGSSLGGTYMQRGTYSSLTIYFSGYGTAPQNEYKNDIAFRKEIGFNSSDELNEPQAQANVREILPYASFHFNNNFAGIDSYGRFTPENAPYIIQKYVEGLITPIEKYKTKPTDEVTIRDVYDGSEKTMTVQDAYKYAVSVYKDICSFDYEVEVGKPNEYDSIEECLEEYAEALARINAEEYEPEDWYERWEHGDFDNLY